jgi:hypothetical protein
MTEADVECLASLVGLTIDPASRAAVVEHLAGLLRAAALFADFPLLDDAEPAPAFHP